MDTTKPAFQANVNRDARKNVEIQCPGILRYAQEKHSHTCCINPILEASRKINNWKYFKMISYSEKELNLLKRHHADQTAKQLAELLGWKIHQVREVLYSLGIYKIRLEYWSKEAVQFLKNNYRSMGDKEIAHKLESVQQKEKGWTLKHVEKKRLYLGLKRSPSDLIAIKKRNIIIGCWKDSNQKMWAKRGVFPEGTIRYQRMGNDYRPVIKEDGRFIPYSNHRYRQLHGDIPKGMNAVFLDGNQYNLDDSNIGLISDAELGSRNTNVASKGLSDNYIIGVLTQKKPELREQIRQHPDIIKVKRLQLQLNRKINENQ